MSESILGIDISKETFDVALRQAEKLKQSQFKNQQEGFVEFQRWLEKQTTGQVHACLEATGRYGEALSLFLYEAGYQVSVVNPARIKAYAYSRMQRNKTDRLDARLIADYCRTQRPRLWSPPCPAQVQLQAMVRYLADLQAMRQQERNRLSAGPVAVPIVAHLLAEHLALFDTQIEQLKRHIQTHIEAHPDLKDQRDLLLTIPGVGPLTAARLLAELPDIHAFDDIRQLVAFAGLNPQQRLSGSSVRGYSGLSKMGKASLRQALYFPAMVARQHNPIIHSFCQRLEARGKPPRVAIAAAMRKLLHLVYGILRSGQPFDPHHLALSS